MDSLPPLSPPRRLPTIVPCHRDADATRGRGARALRGVERPRPPPRDDDDDDDDDDDPRARERRGAARSHGLGVERYGGGGGVSSTDWTS